MTRRLSWEDRRVYNMSRRNISEEQLAAESAIMRGMRDHLKLALPACASIRFNQANAYLRIVIPRWDRKPVYDKPDYDKWLQYTQMPNGDLRLYLYMRGGYFRAGGGNGMGDPFNNRTNIFMISAEDPNSIDKVTRYLASFFRYGDED